ncbi:MAG: putative sugar nucleotidyl transferase [Candidatus Kapaibacterium sp.]
MQPSVLLIENENADELYPFALTHTAWELRSGYLSVYERWSHVVGDGLVSVYSPREKHLTVFNEVHAPATLSEGSPLAVVVASVLLSPEQMQLIVQHASKTTRAQVLMLDDQVIGAVIPAAPADISMVAPLLDSVSDDDVDVFQVKGRSIRRLWDLLDAVEECVNWDSNLLHHRVDPTASVHQSAVIDVSKGPVIIGRHAEIGAMAVVQGPCAIGDHAVVKPLSHITHSVIGPYCKVGGEVSCSILHGYSNKQHYGFLGHSVIGEWVNLGAGTTTSNLKNTYHDVRPTMPWGRESSGRMFLGSMIGDFTRTAIGTLLPTGGVYGVCSHIMSGGMSSSACRSFVWSEGVPYEREAALDTCRTMMQRRGRELTKAMCSLLDDVRESDA